MTVTIKDIAKSAGVSTATVSNVLTQKKYVSSELEQRVYRAIEELGYRPNLYARSLKTNRSYTIGVHVPDIVNPFFSTSVKTIQKEANERGYQIMLYDSDSEAKTEEQNVNSMLSAHVDGIISIAPRMELSRLFEMVEVPLVIMDRPPVETDRNVAFIYADNYRGAASVADYLVEKGYERFICLAGPVGLVSNAQSRVNGFMDTLARHGVSPAQCDIRHGDFTFESGYELMKQVLEGYDPAPKPAAAFVGSDFMAWGAMEALKEKKVKIPRDMGVIGYDNIYYSSFLYPPLTTVENPSRDMALNAIRLLLDAVEDLRSLAGISVTLRSTLIVRKSC
ncbi:MAG TPA: LacI family DNA-binding transcriptional regulator [Candidatus Limiplasma pullicola]|nr:LacI family DNA-binding transcriptional regulator [Candidatus Limiplasma pullicola]